MAYLAYAQIRPCISARTDFREPHWGKCVYVGLTSWLSEGVVPILCFCEKLVLMLWSSAYRRRTGRHLL